MRSHKPKLFTRQQTDPKIERRLDQELEQTFPASDAPQITRESPADAANLFGSFTAFADVALVSPGSAQTASSAPVTLALTPNGASAPVYVASNVDGCET